MMQEDLNVFLSAYEKNFEYEFDNEIMLNWYPRRIMNVTSPACNVLELGIGHGYTSNLFSNHYSQYSVIDASTAVIDRFLEQYPDSSARIVNGYFESFQSTEQYDIIIMGFVLEHVDDPLLLLNYYKKFLRPGGKCFIAVPNGESLHRRFGHAAGVLGDMTTLGAGDLAFGHKRVYTTELLTSHLEKSGYTITRREGVFLKPLTTGQLRSVELSAEILEGMCQVGVEYPELSAGLLFEAVLP